MKIRMHRIWILSLILLSLSIVSVAQDAVITLTENNSVKTFPRVSEDGQYVVYVGDKNQDSECAPLTPENKEIFMASADGLDLIQLTNNDFEEIDPSISADGSYVAFERVGEGFGVFVVDTLSLEEFRITGSAATQSGSETQSAFHMMMPQQTQTPSQSIGGPGMFHPMISGDGMTVVFEEEGDIFISSSNGNGSSFNLTNSDDVIDRFPGISGDGVQIVFSSTGNYLGTNPTGDEEIYAITSFGTNLRQLTRNEVPDIHPWISSDGQWVAFERVINAQSDIFLIPSNGGAFETNLTNTTDAQELFPSLNATGTRVVFQQKFPGDTTGVYVRMNADGTEPVTIANVPPSVVDDVTITLTMEGDLAAFSAEMDDSDCVQVFLSGTPPNIAPLANGGGDQTVEVGDVVQLDASNSTDANDDELNYNWEIVTRPDGSTTDLNNPTSPTPSFEVDVAGEYLVNLTVDDGREGVDSDKINIMAVDEGEGGQDDPSGSGDGSVEAALDGNENLVIDDDEIDLAITYWVLGEPIPGSDGLIIDDDKISELIELWILGMPIDTAS